MQPTLLSPIMQFRARITRTTGLSVIMTALTYNPRLYNKLKGNCSSHRPVRGRGFLLHGLVLSHESSITVLSPQSLRFILFFSLRSLNPSCLMFFAAFMSLSCCVLQCGHVHFFSSPRFLL